MHQHLVGGGRLGVDHRRQWVVVDDHLLGGVDGRLAGGGQHDCDGVAHVADRFGGQWVVRRVHHVVGHRPGARHRVGPRVGQLGAGVHGDDAIGCLGLGGVDRGDGGVGERRSHQHGPQGAGQVEVVGELRFAGEQRRVLAAQPTLAEHALLGAGAAVLAQVGLVDGVGGLLDGQLVGLGGRGIHIGGGVGAHRPAPASVPASDTCVSVDPAAASTAATMLW